MKSLHVRATAIAQPRYRGRSELEYETAISYMGSIFVYIAPLARGKRAAAPRRLLRVRFVDNTERSNLER